VTDDDDCIAAMRAGDRKAGDLLARRYYRELSIYYRKRLPLEEADELTQLTLLETIGRIERFRAESSFHHYVFSVARRIMSDRQRRLTRRITTEPAPSSEPPDIGQTPAPDRIARAELLERLVATVETLDDHYQSVLMLKLHGATNFEISETLDVQYNTVRSRLSRAIAAVRERLDASIDEFFRAHQPQPAEHTS
jgi:RNA polymerase sigma-70 factor (ECF subfamily)